MNESLDLVEKSPAAPSSPVLDFPGTMAGGPPGGIPLRAPAAGTAAATPPRGPGRPAVHGLYSKAAGSDGKKPVRPPTVAEVERAKPAADSVGLSETDVRELAGELLALCDDTAAGWLRIQAAKAKVPDADAEKIISASRLGDRRTKWIAKLIPACVKEWGIEGQVSPTTALALMVGLWGLGIWRATVALGKYAADEEKDHATRPPA